MKQIIFVTLSLIISNFSVVPSAIDVVKTMEKASWLLNQESWYFQFFVIFCRFFLHKKKLKNFHH